MEIHLKNIDDDNANLWHFQIGGIASDGKYRLAPHQAECASPEEWLTEHPAEAQALVDAGQHDPVREVKIDFDALAAQAGAEVEWLEATIPTIADPVVRRIAQENLRMIKAWRYVFRKLI